MTAPNFKVADHPLIQHKLTLLRRKETSTAEFRQLLGEIALLLAFEATRDLPLTKVDIETPLETMSAPVLDGKKLCLVSILRAGNGLLEGMLDLIPSARVGHIGMYRDHDTLEPVEYYLKLPHSIGERQVIVVDPMLATGNSAAAAVASPAAVVSPAASYYRCGGGRSALDTPYDPGFRLAGAAGVQAAVADSDWLDE